MNIPKKEREKKTHTQKQQQHETDYALSTLLLLQPDIIWSVIDETEMNLRNKKNITECSGMGTINSIF